MVLCLSEKRETNVNCLKSCTNFVAAASPPLRLLGMFANTTCTCNPICAAFKSPNDYLLVGMLDGAQHASPHRTSRTHNKRYVATSLRLTFKNFKLGDFLKFSDFNEAPTNSLMMIY